jgi:hypothetical protein
VTGQAETFETGAARNCLYLFEGKCRTHGQHRIFVHNRGTSDQPRYESGQEETAHRSIKVRQKKTALHNPGHSVKQLDDPVCLQMVKKEARDAVIVTFGQRPVKKVQPKEAAGNPRLIRSCRSISDGPGAYVAAVKLERSTGTEGQLGESPGNLTPTAGQIQHTDRPLRVNFGES